jgi:hypothetical protein
MSNHMPLSVTSEAQTKECTQVKEGNNVIADERKAKMRDKCKWREDKKADFMSRLDDINTELCGLGIEMKQNKETG